MKIFLLSTIVYLALIISPPTAQADLFGGDVVVLAQILVQTIQQLAQLRAILGSGQSTLNLLQDINRGINDSLNLMQTVGGITNPGLYGGLLNAPDALAKIQSIYGTIVPSLDAGVQGDTDQNVAEAITLNNSHQYSNDIDTIGEQVKQASHSVSPGGAQKLTAETLGVMLHVMNQQLRAQATDMKIQAQTLALTNKKEKDYTKNLLHASDTLNTALNEEPSTFDIPRF